MNILFLTHYYPPEVNAPATRTCEHCVRWAEAGHQVTVVTCAPNCPDGVVFDGYRNRLRPQVEHVDGVRVIRVWTYVAANAGTTRRIANFLSYMLSAILVCLRLPRPDVVLATSPQFFCGWAGVWVARLKSCPFVLEIRDIWPESIQAVGALQNRWLLNILQFLEKRMYGAARHIVAVGKGYRDRILENSDHPKRVSVITNGVDLNQFVPSGPDSRFLQDWELEGKFVCSYVGTIGMAHGLEVVVEAGRILRRKGREDICFCLVGDGAARRRLEQSVRQEALEPLIKFTGRLEKQAMPRVLASSDACLVHLRKCELFGTVLPSKLFETMAMGRPIIMGVEGEARRIVTEANAGIAMEPDSAESLVQAVESLADNPDTAAEIGAHAREYVSSYYNRDALAAKFLDLLKVVADQDDTPPKLTQEAEALATGY